MSAESYIYVIPILLACTSVDTLRILAMEPVSAKSHWNFAGSVLRVLTENGHSVTAFTPFPENDRENYTQIDVSGVLPKISDVRAAQLFGIFSKPTVFIPLLMNMTRFYCRLIYETSEMKNILRYADAGSKHYDIVISEFSSSECASYVAAKLDLPMIYLVPSPMITHTERDLFGHVPNPATVSNVNSEYAVPETFLQRFWNSLFLAYNTFSTKHVERTKKTTDPQPYDLVGPVKPSLLFSNTRYITEAVRPFPPNVVQIGGVHLKPPESLPDDVLEFIEESPDGVIFFTFGSVVKMSTMPHHILKAFKEALAEVPQRVLWKYEGEMEDVPKNVMIKNWFPQRDILMHPKVKLFISHGGISGVYEAVDAAVPVLGFPVFYDQHRNIASLVDAGMAISMELMSVSKDAFLSSILELINNEKYKKNAKTTSERFKDRPMSPEKLIVYWTEYIHRHKGAPHLKSHSLNLTWYQYFLLDVIAVLLISIFIIIFISYSTVKFIFKYSLKYLRNCVKVKSE